MKKLFAVALALALACCTFAGFAREQEIPFGGDVFWPTFNGKELGLSLPYILLWEENQNENQPELIEPQGKTLSELDGETVLRYRIGEMDVFGAKMDVSYKFVDNIWTSVTCESSFDDEAAALDFVERIVAQFNDLYGTPGWDEENNGDMLRLVRWSDLNDDEHDEIEMVVGDETKLVPSPEVLTSNIQVQCSKENEEISVSISAALNYYCLDSAYYESMGDFYKQWAEENDGEVDLNARYYDKRYFAQ